MSEARAPDGRARGHGAGVLLGCLLACVLACGSVPSALRGQEPRLGGIAAPAAAGVADRLGVSLTDPRLWAQPVAAGGTSGPGASAPQTAEPERGGAGWGAELAVPFFSILLPGLGQYVQGAGWDGVAYTAAAAAGYWVASVGDPFEELPRDGRDQLAYEGAHVAFTAGLLSAWDSFHRAAPALQAVGKYDFLGPRESVGDLMTAPVDSHFLGRWTTWVNLGFAGTVAALILSDRKGGVTYEPYHGHDALFAASLSFNAGVGEEAAFRGWLLPMLHQKLGRNFWAANILQAVIFGALHTQAESYATVIGVSAVYDGWITRRNGWSPRESIFGHFWYDALVSTAELLSDEAPVRFPTVTIRF